MTLACRGWFRCDEQRWNTRLEAGGIGVRLLPAMRVCMRNAMPAHCREAANARRPAGGGRGSIVQFFLSDKCL